MSLKILTTWDHSKSRMTYVSVWFIRHFHKFIYFSSDMSRAKIIDYYLEKSQREGFELDEIWRDLTKNNVDEEEIRIIVRLVDNEMQRRMFHNSDGKQSNNLIWIGLILTVVGASITIGTFTGLLNTGRSFILAYGPFLVGLSILARGIAKKK